MSMELPNPPYNHKKKSKTYKQNNIQMNIHVNDVVFT
jgi:hypothetical protein